MFCEKCGSMIEDGSSFCPNCGARFEEAPLGANVNPNINPNVAPSYPMYEQPQPRKSALGVVLGLVVAIAVVVGIVVAAVHFIGGGGSGIKKGGDPSLAVAQQMYKDLTAEAKKYKKKNGSYPDSDDLVDAMKKYNYADCGLNSFVSICGYDDGEISKIVIFGVEDIDEYIDDCVDFAKDEDWEEFLEKYVKGYDTESWDELDLDDIKDEIEDYEDDPMELLEDYPIVYGYGSAWMDLQGLAKDVMKAVGY
jgi:hypothetical protein